MLTKTRFMPMIGALIFLLSGCSQPELIQNVSASLIPASTETSQPDNTSLPITPTYTFTVTPTEFTPKLDPIIREARVAEVLHTNFGCDLPCWWGITPGTSLLRGDHEVLDYLNVETYEDLRLNGETHIALGNIDLQKSSVINRVTLKGRGDLVEQIEITTRGENPVDFYPYWETYSPKNIVKKYGLPSRIWLETSSIDHPNIGYEIWLFYDPIGMVITYGGVIKGGEIYTICPQFDERTEIDSIHLYLISSDYPHPLESVPSGYEGYEEYFLPLEEATGLSISEFSGILLSDQCFTTDRLLWPD